MKPIVAKSLLLSQIALCRLHAASAFVLVSPPSPSSSQSRSPYPSTSTSRIGGRSAIESSGADGEVVSAAQKQQPSEISKAPTLNGKMVLPVKAMTSGLGGHKVPAVYAILNSDYKRGSGEGWEHVQHVSITRDLSSDISYFLSQKGSDDVAYIRAMSFSYPQKSVMEDFAMSWKGRVMDAGGSEIAAGDGWGIVPKDNASSGDEQKMQSTGGIDGSSTVITVGDEYQMEDDDDDDDEDEMDHEDYLELMAKSQAAASPPPPPPLFVDNTGLTSITSLAPEKQNPDKSEDEPEEVVSPFESSVSAASTAVATSASLHPDGRPLELTVENVDKVLDEVRPYLISDGGNVSVQNADAETGNVYLLLEGACGSCASSTVTMKMGIERVLKEQFGSALGEVIQVDPDDGGGDGEPTELTLESVQAEVNRISTAIVAMGGVVRVVGIDPEVGVVQVDYRGPNRVQKGLELALLDLEFVKHVKFVSQ